jgi:lipoprotein-releasing system permease protein
MNDIKPGRPFSAWEWTLAFRYLRTKRMNGGVGLVAGVAFVAIALAITAMITVMSVMSGFRGELLSRILGFNGHAYVQGQSTFAENYPGVVQQLEKIPGVVSVAPLVESPVYAMGKNPGGAMVRGISAEDLRAMPLVANHIVAGSLNSFGQGEFGGDNVLLGKRLAESLGVQAGETVTLIGSSSAATPMGTNQPVSKE